MTDEPELVAVVQWLPHGRDVPEGWREVEGQPRTHHHHYCRMIEQGGIMSSFDTALAFVLKHEGGWADHPEDPGGATMRGITLSTYIAWRAAHGRSRPSKHDLRRISDDEVAAIYREDYWTPCRCDEVPAPLALLVFDMAVNAGPGKAAEILQQAVGATVDRRIGPLTLAATAAAYESNPAALLAEYSARRAVHYGSLRTFKTFGLGWARRLCSAQAEAMRLAGT